jgi:hypothetical protein
MCVALSAFALSGKGTQPSRLASFRVEVSVPEIVERYRDGVLRAVKACLIHNILITGPVVEVELLFRRTFVD